MMHIKYSWNRLSNQPWTESAIGDDTQLEELSKEAVDKNIDEPDDAPDKTEEPSIKLGLISRLYPCNF